jgi:predicted RNase H-like nuclease (RuvC/YqgF family)
MKNDLESKQKVLTDMQAGIARMKDLKTKVESYDLENNKISTDIENYKPQLEEARRQIDEEIKKVAEGQANSSSITKIILNSMSKESSESLEKVNKL